MWRPPCWRPPCWPLTLSGCSAPFDDDGEAVPPGPLPRAAAPTPTAIAGRRGHRPRRPTTWWPWRSCCVDPKVRVEAVTIAATGLVGCEDGVPLLADLLVELDEPPLPVACGRDKAGAGGRELPGVAGGRRDRQRPPAAWASLPTASGDAVAADGAARSPQRPDWWWSALGPLTNVADLARALSAGLRPARGGARHGGRVERPAGRRGGRVERGRRPGGAARPCSPAPVPVTVVRMTRSRTARQRRCTHRWSGRIAFRSRLPKWWDLTTAAALVVDPRDVETGRFALDPAEPGRLRRTGDGPVRVVRSLDATGLDQQYALTFAGAWNRSAAGRRSGSAAAHRPGPMSRRLDQWQDGPAGPVLLRVLRRPPPP